MNSKSKTHSNLQSIIQGDDESGIEALLFTAEGDMRNALNNLQSVNAGFGILTAENVFKICDQPHPMLVNDMLESCMKNNFSESQKRMDLLLNKGYSTMDIILTLGKVARNFEFGNPLQLSSLMATLSSLNKS
jgi:replication factor C subunit 2/4